jgi:hypothetical protein
MGLCLGNRGIDATVGHGVWVKTEDVFHCDDV